MPTILCRAVPTVLFAAGWRTCWLSLRSAVSYGTCVVADRSQDTLPLTVPSHNKTDEVSVTCLDFADNDTATFWVGTEEGSVYQANRYDRAVGKAGLLSTADETYRGHAGPVTGLDVHPATGSIDFSDLVLTSSVDWTVKLWRAKAPGPPGVKSAEKNSGSGGIAPVYSFEEADDYVFDVKWHPNHPAIFASADGSGKFDLWNLNKDVEVSGRSRLSRSKLIQYRCH